MLNKQKIKLHSIAKETLSLSTVCSTSARSLPFILMFFPLKLFSQSCFNLNISGNKSELNLKIEKHKE